MMFSNFLQDVRIGLRVLQKEKGFCALAVAVLALGICAAATQFSVIRGVMMRGFSFPDAERLADVSLVDPATYHPGSQNGRATLLDYLDLKPSTLASFEGFSAYVPGLTVNLTHQGVPRRLQGTYVAHDFFRTLAVAPALGRDFMPEDELPGRSRPVLLADSLWRSDFNADPAVIGQAVVVNGVSGIVVGVMPPAFTFPANEQIWLPLGSAYSAPARNAPGNVVVQIVAKLRAGISFNQAAGEVALTAQQLAAAFPETNKQISLGIVRPLISAFAGPIRGVLLTMLWFCLGVLMLACVNVMNMQFARATLRARELAIRSSLGATRWRLVRQMLTESLLVSTLGAVAGIALAYKSTQFLDETVHSFAKPIPSWMVVKIDPTVLVFVVGLIVIASLVSGLIPALLASRANAADVLKESGRGNTGRSVGLISRGLVVFQIMVSSLLLVGSLLQLQSILHQQHIDFGYDTSGVLSARVGLLEGDYPTDASRQLFYEKLLRELQSAPDIEAAALTSKRQMVVGASSPIEIEGERYLTDRDRTVAQLEQVSVGYHEVLGQRILAGRVFSAEDSDLREPIAVVNATFAQRYFGRDSAVGRRFRTVQPDGKNPGPWRRIVGVVSDVRMRGVGSNRDSNAGFYLPFLTNPSGPVDATLAAPKFGTIVAKPRYGQRGEALRSALPAAIARVDPNIPAFLVETPEKSFKGMLGQNRLIALMFSIVGLVAVVIATIGLYGVMSFAVNQRTQEFGIRLALGATPGKVLGMIFRQGAWKIAFGLALGLGQAAVVGNLFSRGIEGFLFGVSPTDFTTYAGVALLLSGVSLVAIYVPARRATRVDPMIALRAE